MPKASVTIYGSALTTEICRATDTFGQHIRNGDTIEDASLKVRQTYGFIVWQSMLHAIKKRTK